MDLRLVSGQSLLGLVMPLQFGLLALDRKFALLDLKKLIFRTFASRCLFTFQLFFYILIVCLLLGCLFTFQLFDYF